MVAIRAGYKINHMKQFSWQVRQTSAQVKVFKAEIENKKHKVHTNVWIENKFMEGFGVEV